MGSGGVPRLTREKLGRGLASCQVRQAHYGTGLVSRGTGHGGLLRLRLQLQLHLHLHLSASSCASALQQSPTVSAGTETTLKIGWSRWRIDLASEIPAQIVDPSSHSPVVPTPV